MKSLYESLFDVDDNIDAVDPEKLYGFWNAKTGDEYEEMGMDSIAVRLKCAKDLLH